MSASRRQSRTPFLSRRQRQGSHMKKLAGRLDRLALISIPVGLTLLLAIALRWVEVSHSPLILVKDFVRRETSTAYLGSCRVATSCLNGCSVSLLAPKLCVLRVCNMLCCTYCIPCVPGYRVSVSSRKYRFNQLTAVPLPASILDCVVAELFLCLASLNTPRLPCPLRSCLPQ